MSFLVIIGFTNFDFNFSSSSADSFLPATPRAPCLPSGSNFLMAAVASLVQGRGIPPKIEIEFLHVMIRYIYIYIH